MIVPDFFIDTLKQVLRQRRIETDRPAQVRRHIKIHNGPYSTLVVRVGHMYINFLRLR